MEPYRLESIRKLAAFLRDQPEVEKVGYKDNSYLLVNFHNKFYERWSYDVEGRNNYKFKGKDLYQFDDIWPEFRCQFTRTTADDEYDTKGKCFLYTHKYLNSFKFANTRVFIHRLAKRLCDEGYIKLWLPQDNIQSIVDKINKREDWITVKKSDATYKETPHLTRAAKDLLLLQDFDFSSEWKLNNLFVAINRLFMKKRPVSRFSIVWFLRNKYRIKASVGYPIALSALLRDKFPNMGIINHTDMKWVDLSATLNDIDAGENNVVHVVNSDLKKRNQVILGRGDGKLFNARPDNTDYINYKIL